MSDDKIKELFLFEKYELDVYIITEDSKPIKGNLIINEKDIKLKIYRYYVALAQEKNSKIY